jgi:LPXTG-motif cell wall-anchored protein
MKALNVVSQRFLVSAVAALIFAMAPVAASAQDISTSTFQHGTPTVETAVRNAQVVYVEGNDLVLKLENGKVEHLVVPDSDRFTIDGKTVSVKDLTPGTKLTQTITTTTTPRYVNTVRTIKGKVFNVNAPSAVIVSLKDGGNQIFKVPNHAKFIVNGQEKSIFELGKGMSFDATIVTDETEHIVASSKSVVGQAPAPATPALLGVLLFQRSAAVLEPASTPTATVTAEHVWARLPQTGSSAPLIGLVGLLALATSLGFRLVRSKEML